MLIFAIDENLKITCYDVFDSLLNNFLLQDC